MSVLWRGDTRISDNVDRVEVLAPKDQRLLGRDKIKLIEKAT